MSVAKRIEGVLFVREWLDAKGMITYWCPGCKGGHSITYGPAGTETWTWNGDYNKPTFSPSILANSIRGTASEEWNLANPRCHAFVVDGRIKYLTDCEHELAGQTIDMVPLPEDYNKFLEGDE